MQIMVKIEEDTAHMRGGTEVREVEMKNAIFADDTSLRGRIGPHRN